MRLEHRIGIVVCLAVLGVGTWFFMTRDTGTQEPVAAAPEASPAATDASEEVKQASPTPTHTRSPFADRRDTRRPENRPAPSLSLSVEAERSTLPGIRSETPLDNRTSSVADATPKPVAPVLTAPPRVQTPTTRPAAAVEAPPIKPAEPVAAAPEPAVQTHVLQKGESISRLAQKYYGSERFVPLILEANKQIQDPHRIPVGAKITIPPAPEGAKPVAAKPAATEPKTVAAAPEQSSPATVTTAGPRQQPPGTQAYEVTPDDNWNKIAARVYGSASRWPELFELNKRSPNETPRMLRAGEVIYIPATGTTDTALIGKTSSP
ncbi:MAG: LysM peptidoglycan-binding domain-containing protein [Phycisphaerae bacterium]|nr:LysM peptidoglycan-binding domain-containing protein [Phycisphaerae bacterium]